MSLDAHRRWSFAVTLAVALGVLAAWRAGSWIDRCADGRSRRSASRCRCSCVGYMLIYLFAIKLRWLPVQGYAPIAERLLALARAI